MCVIRTMLAWASLDESLADLSSARLSIFECTVKTNLVVSSIEFCQCHLR
jgi:hypothetical protein